MLSARILASAAGARFTAAVGFDAADNATTLRSRSEDQGDSGSASCARPRPSAGARSSSSRWSRCCCRTRAGRFLREAAAAPGQQHPGLGLLRDLMGWLVVAVRGARSRRRPLRGRALPRRDAEPAARAAVRPATRRACARWRGRSRACRCPRAPPAVTGAARGRRHLPAPRLGAGGHGVPGVRAAPRAGERPRVRGGGGRGERALRVSPPRAEGRVRASLGRTGGKIAGSSPGKEPHVRPPHPRPRLPLPGPRSRLRRARGRRRRAGDPARPRLVVFVSVDQMRADYLERFRGSFTSGLKTLSERGAVFTNARYRRACTETGPGHSVLLSGRSPRSSASWAIPSTTARSARG